MNNKKLKTNSSSRSRRFLEILFIVPLAFLCCAQNFCASGADRGERAPLLDHGRLSINGASAARAAAESVDLERGDERPALSLKDHFIRAIRENHEQLVVSGRSSNDIALELIEQINATFGVKVNTHEADGVPNDVEIRDLLETIDAGGQALLLGKIRDNISYFLFTGAERDDILATIRTREGGSLPHDPKTSKAEFEEFLLGGAYDVFEDPQFAPYLKKMLRLIQKLQAKSRTLERRGDAGYYAAEFFLQLFEKQKTIMCEQSARIVLLKGENEALKSNRKYFWGTIILTSVVAVGGWVMYFLGKKS